MAIFLKVCKLINFETHNSLELSFSDLRGFCCNFVRCESFLEWDSPNVLALCETNLNNSNDSSNFSVRGYLPLIQKDSFTHMHDMSVDAKEELLRFARELSLKNCDDTYLCFWQVLLHYFFFPYWSRSSSLCTVFDAILSNRWGFQMRLVFSETGFDWGFQI